MEHFKIKKTKWKEIQKTTELYGNPHNQPPRPVSAFVSLLNTGPATPPSKGGEMYQAICQHYTFCFAVNSLTILLNSTP